MIHESLFLFAEYRCGVCAAQVAGSHMEEGGKQDDPYVRDPVHTAAQMRCAQAETKVFFLHTCDLMLTVFLRHTIFLLFIQTTYCICFCSVCSAL